MLDAEILKNLPDEYKQELVEYEETFGSSGWKKVMAWAERSAEEAKDRHFYVDSWDEACGWKGKWFAFQELLKLEESTYNELIQLAEQSRERSAIDPLEFE